MIMLTFPGNYHSSKYNYTPFSPLSLDSLNCQKILHLAFSVGFEDLQFPCLKQKKAFCIVHPICGSHQVSRKKNEQKITQLKYGIY